LKRLKIKWLLISYFFVSQTYDERYNVDVKRKWYGKEYLGANLYYSHCVNYFYFSF